MGAGHLYQGHWILYHNWCSAGMTRLTAPRLPHPSRFSKGGIQIYEHHLGAQLFRTDTASPGVMRRVGNYFFAIRLHRNGEFDRLTVLLLILVRIRRYTPILAAVQMLHHAHLNRLLLMIAHLDFERFRRGILFVVHRVVCATPLACEIKGISGVDAYGLIFGGVVDHVLAVELHLSIVVAAVKTHSPLGQRHPHVISLRVDEFAHNPYFRI